MLRKIINLLFFRSYRAKRAIEKLVKGIGSEFTEEILEAMLKGMSLVFLLSSEYRKNIEGFSAGYVFKSRDGSFLVSAVFDHGKMKVRKKVVDRPSITVLFRNPAALMNFIISPKPDILNAMLRQDVILDGNLNCLYKFAYMSNHLRLKAEELIS